MKKCFVLLVAVAFLGDSHLFSQTLVSENKPSKAVGAVTMHPLVVVDGIETDMESMSLDPNNIESITVLKNGSAEAKYGEKGKEGVILITTKRGTQFYKINDFVDPAKDLNKSVAKVQLNGKLLPDKNKLLIDRTAFTNTMISSECMAGTSAKVSSVDILVISTRFAQKK
ncbi:MAG: TonB-dependent receptor plug domain-containing protein [Flavisolibacter sp.]